MPRKIRKCRHGKVFRDKWGGNFWSVGNSGLRLIFHLFFREMQKQIFGFRPLGMPLNNMNGVPYSSWSVTLEIWADIAFENNAFKGSYREYRVIHFFCASPEKTCPKKATGNVLARRLTCCWLSCGWTSFILSLHWDAISRWERES